MRATIARRALVGALLRRELRPARLIVAALVVGATAGALGRRLAAAGLAAADGRAMGPSGAAGQPGTFAGAVPPDDALAGIVVALLARVVVPALALAAAYVVIDRVAADHEAGWLPALAAAGGRRLRIAYALAVPAGVVGATVPLLAVALVALAAAGGQGAPAAMRSALGALPGAAAFTLACTAYAALVAVLLRRRRTALAVAAGGVLLPLSAVAWWQATRGSAPPAAVVWPLAAHVPLLAWRTDGWVLARHATYAAVVLTLVAVAAPRLVARER